MMRTRLISHRAAAALGLIGILLGCPGLAGAAGADTTENPLIVGTTVGAVVPVVPTQAGAGVEVEAGLGATDATASLEAGGSVGPVSTTVESDVSVGLAPPVLPPLPSAEVPPLPPLPPTTPTRPVPREPGMTPPVVMPSPVERPASARAPRRARASVPRRAVPPATGRSAALLSRDPSSEPTIGTTLPLASASTTDDGGAGLSTRERILRVASAAARPALGVLIGLLLAFGVYLAIQRRLDGGDRLACAGGGQPPDDEKISF